MKSAIERLVRFKWISAAFGVSICLVLGGWLWAFFTLREHAQPLVIRWNSAQGILAVGNLTDIGTIAIWALLVIAVNLALAFALEERDWFWGKFVAVATLFVSILIFIRFAAIISVN